MTRVDGVIWTVGIGGGNYAGWEGEWWSTGVANLAFFWLVILKYSKSAAEVGFDGFRLLMIIQIHRQLHVKDSPFLFFFWGEEKKKKKNTSKTMILSFNNMVPPKCLRLHGLNLRGKNKLYFYLDQPLTSFYTTLFFFFFLQIINRKLLLVLILAHKY